LIQPILSILSRLGWQIFISSSLFLGALLNRLFLQQSIDVSIDIKNTTLALGSIGSILALATSVSFAFVVFSINQLNSRKHDLFYKFKTVLFDFDQFLKEYPATEDLIAESQALSWKLKFIRLNEFPLENWDEILTDLNLYLDEEYNYEEDPNLKNKILGYLGYVEEIISEIGMTCIAQVIAGIYIKIVIKAFSLIGLLLLVFVFSYLNLGSVQNLIASVTPVFFATFACLLFVEIGWYLWREYKNIISFTRNDGEEPEFGTSIE